MEDRKRKNKTNYEGIEFMKKIFLACLCLVILLPVCAQKNNHNFEVSKNLDIFNSLYKQLDLYYVDTLDANKLIGDAVNYMLSGLDPFTEYYSQDETDDLKFLTTGKYAGIGSLIQYNKSKERCMIAEPYENMPAAESGLKAGDIILSIDGKDTGVRGNRNLGDYTSSVSNALRGEPGTSLVLKIQRPGENKPREFKLTRRNIQFPTVPYYGMITDSIGYIAFTTTFTDNCSRDLRNTIIELKELGARSLVLDIRGNGGGSLSEAIKIVNFFVPKGKEVVSIRGKIKSANQTYKTDSDPLDIKIPLVVIVNGNSASASEILSGSLQDLDRAVILGRRTYGKGLVQQARDLPYKGALKLTTSKYYIPSGRCIQAYDYRHRKPDGSAGVIPDSLTQIFHTEAGREVRDGGGIKPDVEVKQDSLPNLVVYLANSDAFFDYVTQYAAKHSKIAPAATFSITDTDYNNFKDFVKKADFTYDRQSLKALETLKRMAAFEGYSKSIEEELKALETKLVPNEDYDLDYWKETIMRMINSAIVQRYYYQKGVIQNQLPYDKELIEAKRILRNPSEYKQFLKQK